MRDGLLVGAIVVHDPDFFVAGAFADEVDLGFGDAWYASAQAEDDLVGKSVCDHARRVGRCVVGVLLAEHLWRRLILYVVEPSLHRQLAGGRAQVAESEHGSVRRRGTPSRGIKFRRFPPFLQRIKTLRFAMRNAWIARLFTYHV